MENNSVLMENKGGSESVEGRASAIQDLRHEMLDRQDGQDNDRLLVKLDDGRPFIALYHYRT